MIEGLFNFNITKICIEGDRGFGRQCQPVVENVADLFLIVEAIFLGAAALILLQKCLYCSVEMKNRFKKSKNVPLILLTGEDPVVRRESRPILYNQCIDRIWLHAIVGGLLTGAGVAAHAARGYLDDDLCNRATEIVQLLCSGELNAVKQELIG